MQSPGPIFLFADDDTLAELHVSGDPHEACRSLAEAVLGSLDLSRKTDWFHRVSRAHRGWKAGSRTSCPPSLPLLALTVNAATHMEANESLGIRKTNYYVPFRRLLGVDGYGEPPGFRQTAQMWRDLASWLEADNEGQRGRSTIRTHETFRYVGYPLSQALFRQSDLNRLTDLFDDLELPAYGEWDPERPPISPAELRVHYKLWAPRAAGLSSGARRLAQDDFFDQLLEELLQGAVEHWEGPLVSASGMAVSRIHVGFSPYPQPEIHLWANRREGMPSLLQLSDGLTLESDSDEWYELTSIQFSAELLDDGLEIKATGAGDEYLLQFEPSEIIPLREDSILGQWTSVRRVAPGEKHWLIVSSGMSGEVEDYLGRYAEPNWSRRSSPTSLGSDWALFRDVEINQSPQIGAHPELWRLRPAKRLRLTLEGGLKLLDFGINVYLEGAAPDVWIPEGILALSDGKVTVDGSPYEGPGTEGGRFPLGPLGLGSGLHEVRAGDSSISFSLLETTEKIQHPAAGTSGMALKPGSPLKPLSWRVANLGNLPEGSVTVSGGVVRNLRSGAVPSVESLRCNATGYYLLGSSPAQLLTPTEPESPGWLRQTGLYPPARFDVSVPFETVWVVYMWRARKRFTWQVRLRRPILPQRETQEDRTAAEWARLLVRCRELVTTEDSNLGEAYLELANAILEGSA